MKFQDLFPLPVEWLTDIDSAIADSVSKWAGKEVMAKRLEHGEDQAGLLSQAMKKLFVDLGLQNLIWPEEAGGCNLIGREAAMTMAAACEQASRGDTAVAYLLANTLSVLASFGVEPHRNDSLLGKFKENFCNEKKAAAASLVLPDYGLGEDAANLQGLSCRAKIKPAKKELILDGDNIRPQCSNEAVCLYGVFSASEKGEPVFVLVPAESKGLKAQNPIKQTGLNFVSSADLAFTQVKLPSSNAVLTGVNGFHEILQWYFLGSAACCSGALLACWEILKDWGDNRVIKGKGQVFKENPLVAALMGKVGAQIGTSRILVYNLARMMSRPEIYGTPGSASITATATAVATTVCRGATESINHSMELMASAGYASEWNLERYWRDVKTIECHLGPLTKSQTDMARHYFDLQSL